MPSPAPFFSVPIGTMPITNPPMPTPGPTDTPTKCFKSTLDLIVAVNDYYPSNPEIVTMSVEDKEIEIVDFDDTAENAIYKIQCENEKGRFVELNYKANCTKGSETVTVYVSRQPRCYATTACLKGDDLALFEEYALRLTEKRNGAGWACNGELKEHISTACQYQTDLINNLEPIFSSNFKVDTSVQDKKFLYIFTRLEQEVTFPSPEDQAVKAFGSACLAGGGVLDEVDHATFTCGDSYSFEVHGFPVCLGNSCEDDKDSYNDAVASQFQAKIVKAHAELNKTPDAICTLTSGSTALGAIAGIAVVLSAVVWQLF